MATNKDIEYLKNKTNEILQQVKATNGTVRTHDVKIAKIEQNQSNHFRNHDNEKKDKRFFENMSRGKLLIGFTIVQLVFFFLIYFKVR